MRAYIITFFAYLFVFGIVEYLTKSTMIALAAEILIVGALLIYYRKSYPFRFKLDWLGFFAGAVIFMIWIAIDLLPYPKLAGEPFIPSDSVVLSMRLISMVLIAPIVEEYFTRYFLIRFAVSDRWKKVKIGTFTWGSFIFTTLFFGFAHDMWLAGLAAGIIFNLLYYFRKDIESCVLAHISANLLLAIYILATKTWYFW